MKITIVGIGYVGYLMQFCWVTAIDEFAGEREIALTGQEIEKYLAKKELNIVATTDSNKTFKDAEIVINLYPQQTLTQIRTILTP